MTDDDNDAAGEALIIKEGFICPLCFTQFGSPHDLQHHVQQCGNAPKQITTSKKSRNPFEIIENALFKVGVNDVSTDSTSEPLDISTNQPNPNNIQLRVYDDFQQNGKSTDRTSEFAQFRTAFINKKSREANKLLIRMEKLIGFRLPANHSKRKAYEKSVVPWIDDELVHLCPNCGQKFGEIQLPIAFERISPESPPSSQTPISNNGDELQPERTGMTQRMTRGLVKLWNKFEQTDVVFGQPAGSNNSAAPKPFIRTRHHCRLCGCVMCATCSQFFSVQQVREILNSLDQHGPPSPPPPSSVAQLEQSTILQPNAQLKSYHLASMRLPNKKDASLNNSNNSLNSVGVAELAHQNSKQKTSILWRARRDRKLSSSTAADGYSSSSALPALFRSDQDGLARLDFDQKYKIRACRACCSILDRYLTQVEQREADTQFKQDLENEKSIAQLPRYLQLYRKISADVKFVRENKTTFAKQQRSIASGEEIYSYRAAHELRFDLLEAIKRVDTIGKDLKGIAELLVEQHEKKKLAALENDVAGEPDEEQSRTNSQPQLRLAQLISAIARFTQLFLQAEASQLKALPDSQEYAQLIEQRRARLDEEERLERQRQMRLAAAAASNSSSVSASTNQQNAVQQHQPSPANGGAWIPLENSQKISIVSNKNVTHDQLLSTLGIHLMSNNQSERAEIDARQHEDDACLSALVIQIENVKNYLIEARKVGRQSEAKSFEENLRDLAEAYNTRRREISRGL